MKKFNLLILLFITAYGFAQNQGNFWYFGENAGIDFNTSPATALGNGQINTIEGVSSYSDDLGNLMFYTDGTTIFNRNHVAMPNGSGLASNPSASQNLILEDVSNLNRFIVLTPAANQGFVYSVVDMSLNNSLGDVISGFKNISIGQYTVEKVAVLMDVNAITSWIITYDNGIYYSHQVSGGVINPTPVVSNLSADFLFTDDRGMLKLSPDGTKLVNTTMSGGHNAWIADFNANTGAVTNPIKLSNANTTDHTYGAEFSPDSRFVYVDSNFMDTVNSCTIGNIRTIYQYDTTGAAGWNSAPLTIYTGDTNTTPGLTRGALQLAPDGKIYMARPCHNVLGAINVPNNLGVATNFTLDALTLAPGTNSREGLPNVPTQIYSSNYNIMQGNVRVDSDNNGCDPNDGTIPHFQYTHTDVQDTRVLFANLDGEYQVGLPDGGHILTPVVENPSLWNVTPAQILANFPNTISPVTTDICLTPVGQVTDMVSVVFSTRSPRPGETSPYIVAIRNEGNTTVSGTVTLQYDNNLMTASNSNPVATTPSSNILSWTYSNLAPYGTATYTVDMTYNLPTDLTYPVNSGDTFNFISNVTTSLPDNDMANNSFTLTDTAVNAYDPNNIVCLEGETIATTQVGEYVHYVVNFENLGTAPANTVRVRNFFNPTYFDFNSIVPLYASHDFFLQRQLRFNQDFIFNNIDLDFQGDTTGYIVFKVKTTSNLTSGDVFKNQAQIYFDYNAAIITNEYNTTVDSTAGVNDTQDSQVFSVNQNPVANSITLNALGNLNSVEIININGSRVHQRNVTHSAAQYTIDVQHLPAGIYFLKVTTDTGSSTQRIAINR